MTATSLRCQMSLEVEPYIREELHSQRSIESREATIKFPKLLTKLVTAMGRLHYVGMMVTKEKFNKQ